MSITVSAPVNKRNKYTRNGNPLKIEKFLSCLLHTFRPYSQKLNNSMLKNLFGFGALGKIKEALLLLMWPPADFHQPSLFRFSAFEVVGFRTCWFRMWHLFDNVRHMTMGQNCSCWWLATNDQMVRNMGKMKEKEGKGRHEKEAKIEQEKGENTSTLHNFFFKLYGYVSWNFDDKKYKKN